MGLDNLPGPGNKFKATAGPGSFKKKLSSKIRISNKNLAPYKDKLIDLAKEKQTIIRRGGMSFVQKKRAWSKLKKEIGSENMSTQTRRDLKKIINGLGSRNNSMVGNTKPNGEKVLTLAQRRRNIMESRRTSGDYDSNLKVGRSNFSNTGSKAIGVAGSRDKGLGIKKQETGFAGQARKPDSPKIAPSTGGGGLRPIGL